MISARWLGFGLLFVAASAFAVDAGIVTIADGSARVLRGTIWYRLAAGAPFVDGDLIDAGDRTLVQVELASGGIVHIVGPASLYAAQLPIRNDKQEGPIELALDKGWLKLVAPAGPGMRVRTPAALVSAGEAILVARQDSKVFELFIESGSARIAESNRAGRDGVVREANAGEFWSRDGDKPFATERRAPPQFVSAMPRHLKDRLASLAARYKGKKATTLAVDREVTLAEADPWLAGPYRRAFARRLSARLADPAFRNAVEANAAAYPDFDRILHPEKYPATQAGTTAAPAVPATTAPPTPARTPAPQPQATPVKPGPRSALHPIVVASSASVSRNAP